MADLTIRDVVAIVGEKELQIIGLKMDIESLNTKIKELEDKLNPPMKLVKKENENG